MQSNVEAAAFVFPLSLALLFRFVVVFIIINSRIFALKQRLVMHKERERGRREGESLCNDSQQPLLLLTHSHALLETPLSHSPLLTLFAFAALAGCGFPTHIHTHTHSHSHLHADAA